MSNCKSKKDLVFAKCSGHCAYCGSTISLKKMTIDHIVPVSRGGGSDIDNLLPSCSLCNQTKADFDIETFRLKQAWPTLTTSRLSNFMDICCTSKLYKFYFEK